MWTTNFPQGQRKRPFVEERTDLSTNDDGLILYIHIYTCVYLYMYISTIYIHI